MSIKNILMFAALLCLVICCCSCEIKSEDPLEKESFLSEEADTQGTSETAKEINNGRTYIDEDDVLSFTDNLYKCHKDGDRLIIFKESPDTPFIELSSDFYDDFCAPGYICDAYAGENWVVILSDVALGYQRTKIFYRSEDGVWREIGNAMDVCPQVLTGAGFFSETTGFLSFRYTDEVGVPKIYYTTDGGDTWERLTVDMPAEYADLKMTPLSPAFDGSTAIYPITVHDNHGYLPTIYLISHDEGLTWTILR
ncbi:MAG: hypothetical protein GX057_06325 [Clostridiales bacterium]|nr:hypothetical protein [Clostridiales bacterium]